jgi:hypothetical protein
MKVETLSEELGIIEIDKSDHRLLTKTLKKPPDPHEFNPVQAPTHKKI